MPLFESVEDLNSFRKKVHEQPTSIASETTLRRFDLSLEERMHVAEAEDLNEVDYPKTYKVMGTFAYLLDSLLITNEEALGILEYYMADFYTKEMLHFKEKMQAIRLEFDSLDHHSKLRYDCIDLLMKKVGLTTSVMLKHFTNAINEYCKLEAKTKVMLKASRLVDRSAEIAETDIGFQDRKMLIEASGVLATPPQVVVSNQTVNVNSIPSFMTNMRNAEQIEQEGQKQLTEGSEPIPVNYVDAEYEEIECTVNR